MPPRVDIVALRVMEATATSQAVEGKKKRPTAQLGQYELKRMRGTPWTDLVGEEPA